MTDNNTDKRKIITLVIVISCFLITLIGISFAWAGFGSTTGHEALANVKFFNGSGCAYNRSIVIDNSNSMCSLTIDPAKMTEANASATTPVATGSCSLSITLNGCANDTIEIWASLIDGPSTNANTAYCTHGPNCKDYDGIPRGLVLNPGFFEYKASIISNLQAYYILSAGNGQLIYDYNIDELGTDFYSTFLRVAEDNVSVSGYVGLSTAFYNLTTDMIIFNSSAQYFSGKINDQSWLQQSTDGPSIYRHQLKASITRFFQNIPSLDYPEIPLQY